MGKVSKRGVIEELDKSIAPLSYDKWLELYNDNYSLIREKILSMFINAVVDTANEFAKEKKTFHIPRLGTFKIKEARNNAIEKRKELLSEYGYTDMHQAPESIREIINEQVTQTVKDIIKARKANKNVKYCIKLKNK